MGFCLCYDRVNLHLGRSLEVGRAKVCGGGGK